MTAGSALPEVDARALRVQCKLAVAGVGGPYSASVALGYASQGNISAATDPNDWSRWMRVDHAVVLDSLAPHPFITACMARLLGYQLVRLPAPAACSVRAVGEMLGSLAPVLAAAAVALTDHRISEAERAAMLPQLEAAMASIGTAHATLSQACLED